MKLVKACIAMAAFAALFVVPSIASASNDPALYQPTTTLLTPTHAAPVGIIATNEGKTIMKSGGGATLVECDTATLTGSLETNTPTPTASAVVEGTITAAEFRNHASTHCGGPLGPTLVTTNPAGSTEGLPWCLRSTSTMKTDELQVRGNSCTNSARGITFTLHVTNLGVECKYTRATETEPIPGTYTTHPSAAQASIKGVRFLRVDNSSGFCPSEGLLDMTFNLYRDVANHTSSPIYIKNHDGK